MKKMIIHFDPEADYLEVRFGKAQPAYYEDLGNDCFERRSEENGSVTGYAIFNVQKRKGSRDIEVEMPMIN